MARSIPRIPLPSLINTYTRSEMRSIMSVKQTERYQGHSVSWSGLSHTSTKRLPTDGITRCTLSGRIICVAVTIASQIDYMCAEPKRMDQQSNERKSILCNKVFCVYTTQKDAILVRQSAPLRLKPYLSPRRDLRPTLKPYSSYTHTPFPFSQLRQPDPSPALKHSLFRFSHS